ncbi:MAG TPA: glycosyltransferase [Bacteroidota bacterium]|nr:glycosyltransferase [Bacteroidota bacterium]
MTIFFLTPRIPYPPYRGDKLKIWNLLRQLSKRHRIVLVSFIQSEREREYVSPLSEVCAEIHLVSLPRWKSFFNCVVAMFQNIPFQVAYYRSREMRRVIDRVVNQTKPDLIHTHLIRMAQYTAHRKSYPRVLDMTDAVSLYLARLSGHHRNPVIRAIVGVELKRMLSYESIIAQFDRTLVCSSNDRDVLLQHIPLARIDLLYNGVDLETFSINGTLRPDPYRIILTGNMSYYPNADGAKFFVREIFPHIRQQVPEAKLYIVGQDPPRSVKALASDHVVITGFVPDIRLEYLKSAVAVSPIRFGAGTLNKILEPLALGVPVVSTSIGIDGLGLTMGEDILVADKPQEFAQHVVQLLTNGQSRERVAGSAAEKVRTRFSWDRLTRDLEQIYETIVNEQKNTES